MRSLLFVIRIVVFFLIAFQCQASSQSINPVKWTYSIRKINADSVEVNIIARIDKGWHIYSLYNEGGPGPTTIQFDKNPNLRFPQNLREVAQPQKIREPIFDTYVTVFTTLAHFMMLVERKNESSTQIEGMIKYFASNGKICLPPKEVKFSVAIH
ncbi:MAG: hypothetical protein C5B59_15590 [Bacteroidetes bacterium]|nr:MAG: hypothetical protein C5B59_15590 [Bacteroidota bacterium]